MVMSNLIYRLLPNSAWVLCAIDSRGNKDFKTFIRDERSDALEWIAARPFQEIKVLAANPNRIIFGNPTLADLRDVLAIGIRADPKHRKALEALKPAEAFPYDGKFVAVWKLRREDGKPVTPLEANTTEQALADRFGGIRLNFFVPIPPDNQVHFAPRFIDPKDVASFAPPENIKNRKFVRGDADDDEEASQDIHENWLASENFTYYVGRPKQGKSLAVAKTAAYITAGGTWDGDGQWTDKWFDGTSIGPHARGSVIILEEEDPTLQTKARCRAAGCSMSKVHIRKLVPHISVKEQLSEITDLAEELGDCRMISFSPIQAAIKARDSSEPVIRGECRPLLTWAEGRNIALIGILHTTKDGKALAGSDVLFRIARCVVAFEDGVMEVRDSNIGPFGMKFPFRVETVISKGVKTARIEFLRDDSSNFLNHQKDVPMGKTDKAESNIRDNLNGGETDSAAIRKAVLAEGVSVGAFLDAKKRVFGDHGVRGKRVTLSLS
jgi:hypothetical protein